MDYVVSCLDDDGDRVRATSQTFTREQADAYAATVCATREPEVTYVCGWCNTGEWRKYTATLERDGYSDWPRCVSCGGC